MIWLILLAIWLGLGIYSYGFINSFFLAEWNESGRMVGLIFALSGPFVFWYIRGSEIDKEYKWKL